jgi:serine phosphatase RsbU (regulator of sigma subunit)/CHASE2 domain-containing sensor protein
VILLAALSYLLAAPPAPVERFHAAVFDGYQRIFPLARTAAPVVVVAIDEHSLREFGQWPWPRTQLAELIRAIHDGKPAAIGLDLFFPERDRYSLGSLIHETPGAPSALAALASGLPSNDRIFASAIASAPVVLGISAEREPDRRFGEPPPSRPLRIFTQGELRIDHYPGHIGSIPELSAAAKGHGLINSGSSTEVVRRAPLVARVGKAHFGSLAVATLREAIGGELTVRDIGQGLLAVEFGEVKTIAQEDGTAWIRFGRHDADRFVTAVDAVRGKLRPDTFENKVVLIGITGLGLLDFKSTPLGEIVPGVEVHAQIVENLVAGVSLKRPRVMPRIEALVLIVLGAMLVMYTPKLRAQVGFGLVVLGIAVLLGAGLLAFLQFGTLFDPVLPAMGATAVFGVVLVGTLANSELQRRMLREQAARLAGELDAAKRIQMGLLPNPAEEFADDRRVKVAALLEPARTVGGDFYDCFLIEDRRLFFVVADVSGKGLPAALFMASVKSHLKSAVLRGGDVGTVLTRAQEEIARENPELLFVTAFAGVLDLVTGTLEFSNAGHEPPYARTPRGTPERLGHAGGPPLCVMEGYVYPTWQRQIVPGEWLLVVTDGATEAMNRNREFFGSERLRVALGWAPEDVSPQQLVTKLRDDVHRFADGAEPADDLTLLAVRWEGTSGR